MNNTFNINRFGLLLKRQWLDFGKIYLISLLVILGVVIGFYAWNSPSPLKLNNYDGDGNLDMRFRYGLFLILGFIFISVVASSYYALLGQKPRAILELMTPASTFEKFLAGVFYTAVLSLATYLILYYLVDLSFVKYINAHLSEFKVDGAKQSSMKPVESISAQIFSDENYRHYFLHFISVPFLITSVFLLGSVYFNRFHYIKTAISVMIFTGAASYLIFKSVNLLTRNMVNVSHGGHRNNEQLAFLLIFLITAALTLIFWAITYIRLKEKEV
ncbi:hypothetical protein [Pedobacter sp. Leaf194]|uniref:hypothetical protein n=1 Tax=Pedobacter sp. Leaf194 TaxID=1736297 RepID=UPI000702AF08|nr:hypothetical protein [Pedobacter sp. Leaf194]KQS41292.1 hypothetical protein ASG14_02090 [Pedobacter sp. Leaf194]